MIRKQVALHSTGGPVGLASDLRADHRRHPRSARHRPPTMTMSSASSFCRRLRTRLALLTAALLLAGTPVYAANTDPTLALMRASAVRGAGGRATVTLEGSFSFADAVQLALPLEIVVTQGATSARYTLTGNASLTVGGGPPQAVPPPGVLGMDERTITLVLPAEFTAGDATAQIIATYEQKAIASNALRFTL